MECSHNSSAALENTLLPLQQKPLPSCQFSLQKARGQYCRITSLTVSSPYLCKTFYLAVSTMTHCLTPAVITTQSNQTPSSHVTHVRVQTNPTWGYDGGKMKKKLKKNQILLLNRVGNTQKDMIETSFWIKMSHCYPFYLHSDSGILIAYWYLNLGLPWGSFILADAKSTTL